MRELVFAPDVVAFWVLPGMAYDKDLFLEQPYEPLKPYEPPLDSIYALVYETKGDAYEESEEKATEATHVSVPLLDGLGQALPCGR